MNAPKRRKARGRRPRRRNRKIVSFAYGSNMLTRRIQERVPSARPLGTGYITAHRLKFDKQSDDGSGKCDAEKTKNQKDRVYGVLFELELQEKPALDAAEGLHHGYEEKHVNVVTRSGRKRAVMYYATAKNPTLKPCRWYKALVVAGAVEHKLPATCIKRLRATKSIQDRDVERRQSNERLRRRQSEKVGSHGAVT